MQRLAAPGIVTAKNTVRSIRFPHQLRWVLRDPVRKEAYGQSPEDKDITANSTPAEIYARRKYSCRKLHIVSVGLLGIFQRSVHSRERACNRTHSDRQVH